MRIFFALLLCLFSFTISSQVDLDNKVNSNLEKRVAKYLDQLASSDSIDVEKAYEILSQCAVKKNDTLFLHFFSTISFNHYAQKNLSAEAIPFLKQCERIGNPKKEYQGDIQNHLGNHAVRLRKYLVAMTAFNKAIVVFKDVNPPRVSSPLGNLAELHNDLGNTQKALELNLKCLDLSKKIIDKDIGNYNMVTDHLRISNLYQTLQNETDANVHLELAQGIIMSMPSAELKYQFISNLINGYSGLSNTDRCNELIVINEEIRKNSSIPQSIINNHRLTKSSYYLNTSQKEFAETPAIFDSLNFLSKMELLEYEIKYNRSYNNIEQVNEAQVQLARLKEKSNAENINSAINLLEINNKNVSLNHKIKRILILSIIGLAGLLFFGWLIIKKRIGNISTQQKDLIALNELVIERAKYYKNLQKEREVYFNHLAHDIRGPLLRLINIQNKIVSAKDQSELNILENNSKIINTEIQNIVDEMNNILSVKSVKSSNEMKLINVREIVDKAELLIDEILIKPYKLNLTGVKEFNTFPQSYLTIIKNLLENSFKYCNTTPIEITINNSAEGENIVTTFTDNGWMDLSKKGHSNIKEGYQLGLQICEQLTKKHDGWIKIRKEASGFSVDFLFNTTS